MSKILKTSFSKYVTLLGNKEVLCHINLNAFIFFLCITE